MGSPRASMPCRVVRPRSSTSWSQRADATSPREVRVSRDAHERRKAEVGASIEGVRKNLKEHLALGGAAGGDGAMAGFDGVSGGFDEMDIDKVGGMEWNGMLRRDGCRRGRWNGMEWNGMECFDEMDIDKALVED